METGIPPVWNGVKLVGEPEQVDAGCIDRNTLYERSRVAGKATTMQADEKAVLLLRRKTLRGNGPDVHSSERRCLKVYGSSLLSGISSRLNFTKPDPHISWRFFFNNGGTPLGSMLSCLRHCLSASRLSAGRDSQIQFGDCARA
jgi:hypothetical protein